MAHRPTTATLRRVRHPSAVLMILGACLLIVLGGCTPATTGSPRDDAGRLVEAELLIASLERSFASLRDLPPRERRERYLGLRGDLERAVAITTDLPMGYRGADGSTSLAGSGPMRVSFNYHAKALYWLANWRLLYNQGEGVDELLDRLDREKTLRHAGRSLRVQLRLRQSRITEAHELATDLVASLPEANALLDLVAWHERIGQPAPRIDARRLTGPAEDPWAPGERWVLAVFTPGLNPDTLFHLESLRTALATIPAAQRPLLVQVTFEGSPLTAAKLGAPGEVLLWANPNNKEESGRWREQWRLPDPLPRSALLGPDRSILAVEVTPEQLGRLHATSP